MKKLFTFLDNNILQIWVSFLLLFVPLYPKLPSVHINNTWVYIRLEDFFIAGLVGVWLIQLIRKKVTFSWKLGFPIGIYWLFGLLSLLYAIIVLSPHLTNFFPHVAVLSFFRRIEYMILFFVAASTNRNKRDIRSYIIVLSVALGLVVLYGIGQKYYVILWSWFPTFFQKYPFCFPSFQTGNEEFAKGIPLCLPPTARFTSTFGGHYDLAGYLVIIIPIFAALVFGIKEKVLKVFAFIVSFLSLILLILTASRISFIAYLLAITCTLILYKKKWFIIPVFVISVGLLLIFSGSTAKRFLETIRITSIVTNSQGQIVGEEVSGLPSDLQKKIAKNSLVVESAPPTEVLPQGSSFMALPHTARVASQSAMVQSALTNEQAKKLKLQYGGVEISTLSGSFLIQKALVYDISYTTRFQGEWPNAWRAFERNIFFGSGFSSITLATDNDFLRALGETGILGLGSFMFIFVILGIALRNTLSEVTDPVARSFLFGLAGGFIGLSLNATFIDVFEASKVAESFWLLLGIGGGILLYYQKKSFHYLPTLKRFFTSTTMTVIYLFLIVAIALLASINNFFVADDFTWLHWAASGTPASFFLNASGFFYRPIPKLVVYSLYTFFSFQPQGYHLFILLLHFITVIGVYILGRLILKNKLLAFLAAALFALLPAHGEIVFWFATLSTTLSSVFMLYGVILFILWRRNNSIISLIGVYLMAILSVLSYEMGVVFPILCLITDLCIIKKSWKVKEYLMYIPLGFVIALYALIRSQAQAVGFFGDYSYSLIKLIPNIVGNYIGYMGFYIFGQTFAPVYTSLRNNLKTLFIPLTGVFLFILSISIYFVIKKKDAVQKYTKNNTVHLIMYLLLFTFVPLLTFLGLGNMTERYGYLSSVGYVLLLVLFLKRIVEIFIKNKMHVAYALIIITTFICSIYSYQLEIQKRDWEAAGKITLGALTLFRIDYEFMPKYSNIYIVNMPIKKAQAWIFPVGFPDGLWFIFRDPTLKIVSVKTIDEAKALKAQAQAATKAKNFIFNFDKNGQLSEVK